MRVPALYALLLFVALSLTGCSAVSGVLGSVAGGGPGTSSAPAVAGSTPSSAPAATPGASLNPRSTSATTNSSDPAIAAIQGVIQKANQEQQDAFAKNDPTIMQDTATSSYYNELVQINNDMASGGVSAIKLLGIDWGQVSLTSPTTAQATTFETWQTTYTDGSTDQSRDQNDYTLVLDNGVWKIQTDDNGGSNPGGSGGSPASGSSGSTAPGSPSAPPPPPVSTPASRTDTSRNWAGYAATSGTFTGVTGTWSVPQPQSTGNSASGATWVGIGGANSRDLIQAGTEETVSSSGRVRYDAWIETLPQTARVVPFTVKAGDSVTISINEQGTNQWLIEFQNHTTGASYQRTVDYTSSLSSAEWIEEAPVVGRRIAQIDDFGTILFSGGSAVQNGKTVTIEQAGGKPITMGGGRSGAVVTPSVLTPDGQGFSISRSTSAPVVPGFPRSPS